MYLLHNAHKLVRCDDVSLNSHLIHSVSNTGLRLNTFFKRSKVFQLILACFDALNPNILSIFFGQLKFLRYV